MTDSRGTMNINKMDTSFKTSPGFCPECGSILPLLENKGGVICYSCKHFWEPEVYGTMALKHTIQFNKKDVSVLSKNKKENEENKDDGPIVERHCPKCNNTKMSYATLQLRSADEGQTVFYTCTKCKFKETENS